MIAWQALHPDGRWLSKAPRGGPCYGDRAVSFGEVGGGDFVRAGCAESRISSSFSTFDSVGEAEGDGDCVRAG